MVAIRFLPLVVLVAIISQAQSLPSSTPPPPTLHILNGDSSNMKDGPFTAFVLSGSKQLGKGVILGPHQILTNAVATEEDSQLQVRVGSKSATEGGKTYEVKTKKQLDAPDNSLMLLELKSDIEFSDSVEVIKFGWQNGTEIKDGAMMMVNIIEGDDDGSQNRFIAIFRFIFGMALRFILKKVLDS